jgi:hypothetical protein
MITYFICDKELQRHVDRAFGACKLIDIADWFNQVETMERGVKGTTQDIHFWHPLGIAIFHSNIDAERLHRLAADLHIPCRLFAEDMSDELNAWIVSLLLDDVRVARIDAELARKNAAILRREFEMQQQAFFELENAVNEFGMPLIRIAMEWPVGRGTFCLSSAPDGEATLQQQLPVSARGLAHVDIHVDSIHVQSEDCRVEVQITDLSGNPLTSSMPIDIATIKRGWNRIPMLEPANCADKDAMLAITMRGAGTVDLALAPVIPLSNFRLKLGNKEVADAPIALKIWRGFPGLKAEPPNRGDLVIDSVRISPDQIGSARTYFCDQPNIGFDPVQYWQKEDGFLVHPPGKGMTVAIIEGLDLQSFNAVTAIVNNNHREASPLSFAIGLVPSGQDFHMSDVFGTWLTLPSTAWGEVHALKIEAHKEKYDLLMACMVASGDSSHMAWGLFRGFLLHNRK